MLATVCTVVQSQGACEKLTTDVLGNSIILANTGLIGEILDPVGDSVNIPDVQILNMNIVCESQNVNQNRYGYTSVVVEFVCSSTHVSLETLCNGITSVTRQFDLGCSSDDNMWTTTIFNNAASAQTINPVATLSTELDLDCRLCINPDHPTVSQLGWNITSDTHCYSMCF